LPTFALGVAAAAAAWINFPLAPPSPAALFNRDLGDLKQALDSRPIDRAHAEALVAKVAGAADQFPAEAARAHFLAGSAYAALAEAAPTETARWTDATEQFKLVDAAQLADPNNPARFRYRQALTRAALGTGDANELIPILSKPPLGEELAGERRRLLADVCLRAEPKDLKRASEELTTYLSGPTQLPADELARYKLKLGEALVGLNEAEKGRNWLTDAAKGGPADVRASAVLQLGRLAASENNWTEAVKQYEAALAAPGLPADQRAALLYQTGAGLVQLKMPPAARTYFERAAKEPGPVAVAALVRLAELTLRDGNFRGNRAKAIDYLDTAIGSLPAGTAFRNPYLTVTEVQAVFEEAVQVCLNEAEYGSATRAATTYGKVSAPGRDREKRAEANAAWAAALHQVPATATQAAAKFKEAATDYAALAETYPTPAGQVDLLRRAVACFRQAGDSASAATVLERITKMPGLPADVVAASWLDRGEMLLNGGKLVEAAAALEKAMAGPGPAVHAARVKLAMVYVDRAKRIVPNTPAAQVEARKLVELAQNLMSQEANATPDSPAERDAQQQALFELGKLLLQQGTVADAEARFRQLIQLHPAGTLAGQARLYLGSCLLLIARGDHLGGRPPADADSKLTEAAKLFQALADSPDEFLRTQADVRLANATLLLKKYDEMPALCEKLATRYKGKVEELIVLSMLYSSYRFADRPEPAARVLNRMEEVFAKLPDGQFRGGAEEYTREYWKKQWFEPLKGSGKR
jgi:TolA-binding protein